MSWSEYARIRKIGEGAFGSAWLVKHNKTHSQFVIKQINVAKMQPKEREEARKEVAVLAQMKHPNIVSYIDSFDEVGNLCIVMDYCDGGDLYNKIRSMRGVAISEDQILDWFVQITLALKHVHDRKILHRDLKSQNIFLTKDGTIKLGDFGVAKVLGSTMDFARTAIGTPYYMSPEICEHKPYNNKTDVWSLGCILYEMINLRHPFEANNIQMLIYKILRGSFDQLNPKYSYELRNLVACMLKKNPRERPSVNGILRKAFIMKRCEKFLTNEKLVEEFSHTVLHGENFKNKIQSLANKPAAVGTPRVALTPRSNLNNGGGVNKPVVYDPSKVYKSPVVPRGPLIAQPQPQKAAQQPVEKKATPTPVVRKRPNSAQRESVESSSERNKPIGYLEQQRLKRVAAEEERLKKRHLELIEKQRQERINKAREAGWQHVLGDGLNKDENQPSKEEKSSQQGKQAGDVIRVDNYPYVNFIRGSAYNNIENNNKNDNNNNIYAHYHRQLDEFVERRKPVLEQQSEIARRMGTPAATPATPRPVIQGGLRRSAVGSRPGSKNNQILEDFLRRKEEYERNRLRGQKAMAVKPPTPTPAAATPGRGNDEKWAYEQRLMRVRQQNYENRRAVANKDILPSNVRMQKIAALKQQSEEQRQKLNKELEKKRIEAYEKERKAAIQAQQQQQQQQNRPHSAADQSKSKEFKPEPPVNMTEVLSAIGVVGKKISKEEVLKNLNDEYHPRPESARKGWQKASDLSELENKTLYKSDSSNSSAATPRKIWDQPHDSVLRGFELAKVSPITLVPGQADFERTVLKMGTLKPTAKNLLLDMTMGQFDAKSAKMLRTCSVPDLSEPVASDDEKEAAQKNDKIKVVEKKMDSDELKLTTKRLFKSLEDLSKEEDGDNKENNSPSPVEMPRKKRADSNELVAEYDDISQVRETMESILYQSYSDSEEEDDDADVKIPKKEPKRRQKVNFTSSPVASISVSELPIDSLDLNKKKSTKKSLVINDDNDCETVVLNGEDESEEEDTEFEDEVKLPMPIQDNKARIQAIEETRQFLEQNLGPKNFLQAYPAIQNQIMVEEADPNEKGKKLEQRKSYELFKKKFPNKDLYMFFEFYELVMAEAKSNED